jgi:hypothetical protein
LSAVRAQPASNGINIHPKADENALLAHDFFKCTRYFDNSRSATVIEETTAGKMFGSWSVFWQRRMAYVESCEVGGVGVKASPDWSKWRF